MKPGRKRVRYFMQYDVTVECPIAVGCRASKDHHHESRAVSVSCNRDTSAVRSRAVLNLIRDAITLGTAAAEVGVLEVARLFRKAEPVHLVMPAVKRVKTVGDHA